MRSIRLFLSALAALLLMAGYIANEVDRLNGTAALYIAKVNEAPIRLLVTIFFLAAVVLALVPDKASELESAGEES